MAYIVIDFEFNQAYDFEDGNKTKINSKCRFEIIQIGAIKLDENLNIANTANFLIKPSIYKRMHPFVEKITGLNMKSLENEQEFPEVYKKFYSFMSENTYDKILCVWGNSDITALYKNLSYYKLIKFPLIIKYIDVQKLATNYLRYSRGGSIGLKNAVEALGLSSDNQFHDAYYDALYTAKVFKVVKPNIIPIKIFNPAHL